VIEEGVPVRHRHVYIDGRGAGRGSEIGMQEATLLGKGSRRPACQSRGLLCNLAGRT